MSDQQNEIYRDPAEIRHQIGANGQFTLSVAAGSVEIRAGDSGEAVVLARSEGGRADALPLSVRKSDGALQIEVTDRSAFAPLAGWFGRHSGVDFQVTLPVGARATISTVSADIRSEGLTGEQTYRTVSGDAELSPAGGRLRVSTVSGDMQVRNSGSIELSLNTTSGDMRVRGAELKAFDARSVSGDIDLAGSLAAGPLHSAETVSGDLAIDAHGGVTVDIRRGLDFGGGPRTLVSGDGAAQLRFRTLSGDVRVEGGRRADQPRDREPPDGTSGRRSAWSATRHGAPNVSPRAWRASMTTRPLNQWRTWACRRRRRRLSQISSKCCARSSAAKSM